MAASRWPVVALLGAVVAVAAGCPGGPTAPPTVAMISINASSLNPRVGDVVSVTAVAENAQGVSVNVSCSYASIDPTIASVNSSSGAVTALAAGTADIRATCGNKSADVTITVLPREVTMTLSYQGGGNGAVQALPSSSGGVLYKYDPGTSVKLTAIASPGSMFKVWVTGPCAGSNNPTCVFVINADATVTAQFDLCVNGFCGTIFVPTISLYYTPAGLGYSWTGSVTLQFSVLPPPLTIRVYYFGFDISGTANTNTSSTTLTIPLSGSSIACALVNGNSLQVENLANPSPLMALIPITWQSPGCP